MVSLVSLFGFTTLVVIFLELFADGFTRFHGVSDVQTLSLGIQSIRLYAVSLYGMCFTFFMIYLLPITGKKAVSTIMSICEGFVFIVPLCFLFSSSFGFKGIWYAFILTELLTAAVYCIGNQIERIHRNRKA